MPKKGQKSCLAKGKSVQVTPDWVANAPDQASIDRLTVLQLHGCPNNVLEVASILRGKELEEALSSLELSLLGKQSVSTVAPTDQAAGGSFAPPNPSQPTGSKVTVVYQTSTAKKGRRTKMQPHALRGNKKKGSDERESDEEEGEALVESEGEGDGHGEDDDQGQHDDENPAPPASYTMSTFNMDVQMRIMDLFYNELKSLFNLKLDLRTFNVMLFLRRIEELRQSKSLGTFFYPNAMASLPEILAMKEKELETRMWGGSDDATTLAAAYLFGKENQDVKEPDGSFLATMMPILNDIVSLKKLAEDSSAKDERASARTAAQFNPELAGAGSSRKRRSKSANGAPAASTCPFLDPKDLSPEEQSVRAAKFVSCGHDPNGTGNVLVNCWLLNRPAKEKPSA